MAKANLVLQAQAEVEVKGGGNRQVEACGKVSSAEVVLETQFSYLIKEWLQEIRTEGWAEF